MNNPIKNNIIGYSGKVKILYQDSKGKYRVARFSNEGKMPLFSFITLALQGTYSKDLAPRYLNGLYVDGSSTSPAFFQKVILTKTPVRKNSANAADINTEFSDCIEYCFTINPGILIKDNKHAAVNRLQLLNSLDNDNVCAEIDLDESNSIVVGSGSMANIMVYWTLQFRNVGYNSEETQLNNLSITVDANEVSTRHFSTNGPIKVKWHTNSGIGKNNMYFDGIKVKTTSIGGSDSDPLYYEYDWNPSNPSTASEIQEIKSASIGIGTASNKYILTKPVTCAYTHYVYCGFCDKLAKDMTGDDIKDRGCFEAIVTSSGNLPNKGYTNGYGDTGAYLYYAAPKSYVEGKKLIANFGVGETVIDTPICDESGEVKIYNIKYGEISVEYILYQLSSYLQTGDISGMQIKLITA